MTGRRIAATLTTLCVVGVAALSGCSENESRMVTTSSDSAYHAYEHAMDALERFDLEAARDSFAAAIERDPQFAMAHLRLAQARMRLGDHSGGMEALDSAVEVRDNATRIEKLTIEQASAAAKGKSALAKTLSDSIVTAFPEHPWALRLQAAMAKLDNRFDEALTTYDRILEIDPDAVDVHNEIGYLHLAMGEYDDAVRSLQRYAFYAPDQANPHDSLGEAYFFAGRFEDATKEFLRALEIDPTFAWSGIHLAQVLSTTGQTERAHRVLDEMEPLFDQRGWTEWLEQSRMTVDLRAERWEDIAVRARDSMERNANKDDAGSSESELFARFMLTLVHLERGELDAALDQAALLDSVGTELLARFGEYGSVQARAVLNEAHVRARLALASGDAQEELQALAEAIASSPLSPHELAFFRYELAEGLAKAGRYEESLAVIDEALELIPTLPALNFIGARVRAKLGEREEALRHLQTYLEVMRFADGDHPRVVAAQRMLERLVPRS